MKLSHLKRERGWALVDALIGTVIIATALTALAAMYTQATKGVMFNRGYTTAIYVAQKHLEDMKQYDNTSTIKTLPTSVINPPDATVDGITYHVQITSVGVVDSLNSRLYPYRATVSWPADNPTNSIQVVSYYYSD